MGGHTAVTFFFTLSGFVFFWLYQKRVENRTCTLNEFVLARFARLYPLHILTLVIVLLLQQLFVATRTHPFVYNYNDGYHFLLHVFFASHWGFEKGHSFNAPIWSVSIEVLLYTVFFAVSRLRLAGPKFAVVIVFIFILLRKAGYDGRLPQAIECFFVGGVTYYAVQYYFAHNLRTKMSDWALIFAGPLLWFGMWISSDIAEIIMNRFHLYARLLFPMTIAALVIAESTGKMQLSKIKWLGDLTYSSYLIHFPLQLIFALLIGISGFEKSVFLSPLVLGVFISLLIPLSLVTFHYFERPSQKFIRRLFSRKTP